ncbi:putative reverse transcriptase domain-containing protein [Tanacetum coccineum]
MSHLRSAKTKEKKQEEIVVVRDYPEVFLSDLSGLPPIQEIKFRIELVPEAIPVAKSPYRLARSEMEELLGQLKELQHKGFIKLGLSPWGTPVLFVKKKDGSFMMCIDYRELNKPEDFMVYCDASGIGLGYVLMQRGNFIAYASRQLKIHEKNYTTHDLELDAVCHWIELFSDYDCEIRYHLGKANVVADALKASDESARLQKGLDEMIEHRSDGALYYLDRNKDRYWWPGMKKDIAVYVSRCLTCLKVNVEHQRTSSGHDTIQVFMDRLTKSAYFLHMREDYKMDRLARLCLNEIVARHGVPILIISDRDSCFTLRFWQSMQEALGTRLDMSTTNHPQTDGQSERTIQTLKGMLRACVLDFRGS